MDGVLLANELHPANFANEFLTYVLTQYSESTYWLTTRCDGDANVPMGQIAHLFDPRSTGVDEANQTDIMGPFPVQAAAIGFSRPFLWFDDDLFLDERRELTKNGVLDDWIEVDLRREPNVLGRFLDSFPMPIEHVANYRELGRCILAHCVTTRRAPSVRTVYFQ